MSAKIVKRIIFEDTLVIKTPLRIGSGATDNITDMLVLKNKEGNAFIPGTSLAGVLRYEFEALYGEKVADLLFGSIRDDGAQSLITISDVEFTKSTIMIRDGVSLDSLAGTSKEGAKFDFEAVERGAEGNFRIEITVRDAFCDEDKLPQISYRHEKFAVTGDFYGELAASLADILSAGISIGASTAKGFGKVSAKSECGCVVFDFADGKDAEAWLKYLETGKKPERMYVANKQSVQYADEDFVLEAEFALRSALLVRDYEAAEGLKIGDKNINAVQMKSKGDYVIPGTSIKGTLRSYAEKILLAMSGKNKEKTHKFIDDFMGFASDKESEPSRKSKLLVDEIYIGSNKLVENEQTRNRIDRFTGGTIDTALFTEIPVWQQSKGTPVVNLRCRVQKCTEAEAGLMLLLLRELWLGYISLGGGKAIGRGVLQGVCADIHYKGDVYTIQDENIKFTVKGDKYKLETYVKALAGEING